MRALDWSLPEGKAWEWFVATPGAIALIVVVGLVFRWLACRAIDRVISRTAKGVVPGALGHMRAADPLATERRHQRASTVGSLLKSVVTSVVLAMVIIMSLDKVGVPVAPIIASAGVVGVALGFGAQNLVKDYLAGIFMILEDQYGVGDSVDLGEASGTVEAVSLRVTRLRDVNGTVWYARNGEILRVGNQSQNWARTVLDITVSYESDLARVQEVLAEVAHDLFEDPLYHDLVLGEPSVWGVERFDKDGAVVRVVLKTAPGQQWPVARALRERIKAAFDAEGIVIPTSAAAAPTGPNA